MSRILFYMIAFFMFSSCASQKPVKESRTFGSGSTVAVWNLEDVSVVKPEALGDMQEFLTAKVVETLGSKGGFKMIERQKLLLALEELNVGSSALASESSRLKVGQIIGAELMVFGGYQLVGKQFRIDLRMVEVSSGAVFKSSEQTTTTADISGWIEAAEKAANKLLSSSL